MASDIDRCMDALARCEQTAREIRVQGDQIDRRLQTCLNRINACLGRQTSASVTGHRIMDPLTLSRFAIKRMNDGMAATQHHLEKALESLNG